MFLSKFGAKAPHLKTVFKKEVSLSSYLPSGTEYYYGYPAGLDSGFLNRVTPAIEELVAARVNSCAGDGILAVNFYATMAPNIPQDVLDNFAIPQSDPEKTIVIPKEIDLSLEGEERNKAIKDFLKNNITPHNLVMAQPYTDPSLADIYQISADTAAWLNDKSNMETYIGIDMLPKRYELFTNGAEFYSGYDTLPLPAVIKASLSSSGDGVCLCFTKQDIKEAAERFLHLQGNILVEQYIDTVKNYGVHFGIPSDPNLPIDIIGVNEQLTTKKGEFIGGIIEDKDIPKQLVKAVKHLKNDILPVVRSKGWYGIGGFDVLVDTAGEAYFIDCNFRMTGMSAYHFLVANNVVHKPLAAFMGQFEGTAEELKDKLHSYGGNHSKDKFLHIITISRHGNTWRFNAAFTYDKLSERKQRAKLLLDAGVSSQALSFLAN